MRNGLGGTALTLVIAMSALPSAAPLPPAETQRSGAGIWVAPIVEESESRQDVAPGETFRVAIPHHPGLTPETGGVWTELPGGDREWRLTVRSPGALWLALGFDTFRLPPGAALTVLDAGGAPVHGPLTDRDEREHGQLWLPPSRGDELTLRLTWPRGLRGVAPALRLETVAHGYRGAELLLDDSANESRAPAIPTGDPPLACEIDINCPLGDDWQTEKRGAVLLLIGGTGTCSGSMINSLAPNSPPYLLTANHCVGSQSQVDSTIFFFNKERSGCGTGSPATTNYSGAATLRATWTGFSNSDLTLVELGPAWRAADHNVYFNGWSRATTPATESWMIHFPKAEFKKISYDADPLVTGSFWGTKFWRVTEFDEGEGELGSSGAPLFDPAHRIIGQYRGGEIVTADACSVTNWHEFGKFDKSWDGGLTASTRLKTWLDPANLNVMTLDGRNHTVMSCNQDSHCDDVDVCTIDGCDLAAASCTTSPAPDGDGDLVCDAIDNCLTVVNPLQENIDEDPFGDACETGVQLADADLSGRVDGVDLARLGRAFGANAPPRYDPGVDFNRDGWDDGDDLAVLALYFGESLP